MITQRFSVSGHKNRGESRREGYKSQCIYHLLGLQGEGLQFLHISDFRPVFMMLSALSAENNLRMTENLFFFLLFFFSPFSSSFRHCTYPQTEARFPRCIWRCSTAALGFGGEGGRCRSHDGWCSEEAAAPNDVTTVCEAWVEEDMVHKNLNYMCIHMYIHMCINMCIHMDINVCMNTCLLWRTHMYVQKCIDMLTHVCMSMCIHA